MEPKEHKFDVDKWRADFDIDIAACKRAIDELRSYRFPVRVTQLSAEDCALLWGCGIKAEEDICGLH